MQPRAYLGWSATFMKDGLALFLCAMYEGAKPPTALRVLMGDCRDCLGFSANTYGHGLPAGAVTSFPECFAMWEKTVTWPAGLKEQILHSLESSMNSRTKAITSAGRTSYYNECVRFLAGIGEVRESLGEAGAKDRILRSLRASYPRHSRLHQEMRQYGWKG